MLLPAEAMANVKISWLVQIALLLQYGNCAKWIKRQIHKSHIVRTAVHGGAVAATSR
jgi:hypothetical protein